MTNEKVQAVNDILLKGEPENISVDEHSGYTGYKPQSVVDAMNEVFWGEWGFKEISSEIIASEKGGLAVAQVQVWIKGVEFQPTSYGQNRVTRGDIGDARKGAQTDAIKKALSYFSIGNRAYHGLLPDKKEQAQARQQSSNQRQPTPAARPVQATERKPAQEAPKTDAQSDDLRPAGAAEQALERLAKECAKIVGEEKGPAMYLRIYNYAREKFHVGSDTPDASTPDEVLTEMWNQVRKAKKQALAKAS